MKQAVGGIVDMTHAPDPLRAGQIAQYFDAIAKLARIKSESMPVAPGPVDPTMHTRILPASKR